VKTINWEEPTREQKFLVRGREKRDDVKILETKREFFHSPSMIAANAHATSNTRGER